MRIPTPEEQRQLVQQWEETGVVLERIRREALSNLPYDWKAVDALLDIGVHSRVNSRTTSGLVEMQRLFMKAAPHV